MKVGLFWSDLILLLVNMKHKPHIKVEFGRFLF